jgi:preprotein translocase subunit YajC
MGFSSLFRSAARESAAEPVQMSFSFQAVQPQAGNPGTPGVAVPGSPPPAAAPAGAAPNPLYTFAPFLILVPFLFLSFRRNKKEKEARGSMKKGDRVVTQSGLIGELVDLDERIGKVKIAPGTTVQVLASALSPFDPSPEKKADTKDLEDLKEAKAGASDKK